MDWKKIAVFVVVASGLVQAVRIVESLLTMGYYLDPAYFAVWSKIMMPGPGAPPATFFALSVLITLISTTIFAFAYLKFSPVIKQSGMKKGLVFGAWLSLITQVPFTLYLLLLINLPAALLAAWAFTSVVINLGAGVLAEKML